MQTIIVTGASGNLGQAVVKKFLDKGYKVIGSVVANDPVPMDISNANFEKIVVDLGNENEAGEVIKNIVSKYGSVDAAVLTVGGFAMGSIKDTTVNDIKKQFKLNFETAYNTARPLFTHMMEQKRGRIFLTGARTGIDMKNSKGMVAYGLSKSLIFRLAELMNEEAKGTDVVTAVVAPSTIDTPQNRQSMPNADPGKWVKPEAIADIIYFYCQPESSVIREPIIKVYHNA
jgi:NAD(P)-dependent dehydrogenase (short-subunit alcohol dehydrogenase family)